ncbi:hypothetical protein PMAYCL1PPCAC_00552 [Pristionchus mayeri]|uniref:C2H2-type domain-containing protein n=1 Tax=Pristionchus mayeri TaxID=1317129 RepID=A0AAN4Z2U4_9BILA|nr:hypothetical protein PMAYCL1PPCAC_00552 [Pristionchus mayeri]
MLNSEICEKINSKRFFFCSFCERFMFSARHVFMHISCDDHKQKVQCKESVNRANELLIAMIGEKAKIKSWFVKEDEEVRLQQERWPSMDLEHPDLRPTKELLDFLHEKLWKNQGDEVDSVFAQGVVDTVAQHMDGGPPLQIVQNHIGQYQVRCFQCQLIFTDYKGYCRHLTTFTHLNKKIFDAVTVIYNLEQ